MRVMALPGTIVRQLRLLRDDPERFAANLLQFTNPRRFREKLFDIEVPPPLRLRFDAALGARRALNVLLPVLSSDNTTGGPNTVLHLALRIARHGVPVRMVTTRPQAPTDPAWFRRHLAQLVGGEPIPESFAAVSAAEAGAPLAIGRNDLFMATHWTTAQQLKPHLAAMNGKRFVYLIQDFEPGFHPWSSNHALTLETYDLDFLPVFNEQVLADYFAQCAVGRFADAAFARTSLVFEPAVDRAMFLPSAEPRSGRRRLLFYARPTNERNLFGLGFHALRSVAAHPAFAGWDFAGIGGRGSLPDLELGGGRMLRSAPWLDYAGYARVLAGADILLCLMLSPHTSYPPLEFAACGGLAIHNTYATKTAARLAALSPNIVAVEPTVDGIVDGLRRAVARLDRPRTADIALPASWDEALRDTVPAALRMFRDCAAAPA